MLSGEDLLEQLPALQQLLYRLIGCQVKSSCFYTFVHALEKIFFLICFQFCSLKEQLIATI